MSNLTKYFPVIDLSSIKRQFNLLQTVQMTPYEGEQVMSQLKYKQEMWAVLWDKQHPWYEKAKSSVETLLRGEFPVKHPVFLVHLQSNWLIIWDDGEVYPAIFLFNPENRDGLAVGFYRIMSGKTLASDWVSEWKKLVYGVLGENKKPELPSAPTSPYVILDLGNG